MTSVQLTYNASGREVIFFRFLFLDFVTYQVSDINFVNLFLKFLG